MMLYTFENYYMDSRLESFAMRAGKLVPVENYPKDPDATERIKFYVLQLKIKEVFRTR